MAASTFISPAEFSVNIGSNLIISGQIWGNESKHKIICLHGWLDNCRSFELVAPALVFLFQIIFLFVLLVFSDLLKLLVLCIIHSFTLICTNVFFIFRWELDIRFMRLIFLVMVFRVILILHLFTRIQRMRYW